MQLQHQASPRRELSANGQGRGRRGQRRTKADAQHVAEVEGRLHEAAHVRTHKVICSPSCAPNTPEQAEPLLSLCILGQRYPGPTCRAQHQATRACAGAPRSCQAGRLTVEAVREDKHACGHANPLQLRTVAVCDCHALSHGLHAHAVRQRRGKERSCGWRCICQTPA